MEQANHFSYGKAAEKMEVSEEQLKSIAKAGGVIETDSGLIDAQSLQAWLRRKEEIAEHAYSDHADATKSYDFNSHQAHIQAEEEAQEHFKKELKAFADARWNKWNEKAQKDLEAEYAAIEKRRLEKLKELGAA